MVMFRDFVYNAGNNEKTMGGIVLDKEVGMGKIRHIRL